MCQGLEPPSEALLNNDVKLAPDAVEPLVRAVSENARMALRRLS